MSAPCLCQECGNRISDPQREQLFCSAPCRQTFNNRRMKRGAELYDLFRALRRERGKAKELNLWTQICRLELEWQMQDEAQRPGRKSYMPPEKALANLLDKGALQRGEIMAHNIRAGR